MESGWLVFRVFFNVNCASFKLTLQTAKTICCPSAEMFHFMMGNLFQPLAWDVVGRCRGRRKRNRLKSRLNM